MRSRSFAGCRRRASKFFSTKSKFLKNQNPEKLNTYDFLRVLGFGRAIILMISDSLFRFDRFFIISVSKVCGFTYRY